MREGKIIYKARGTILLEFMYGKTGDTVIGVCVAAWDTNQAEKEKVIMTSTSRKPL